MLARSIPVASLAPGDPDLKLFYDTTRQLVSGVDLRRLHDEDTSFDRQWWARAAELGWTALLAPEELGGGSITGSGVADLAVLVTELGKHAAPGPLLPVSTVIAGLSVYGADVGGLVDGSKVATWAFSGDGVPRFTATGFTAVERDGGYVLSGAAERVEAAPQADVFLVPVTTPAGVLQFLVAADAPGVTVTRVRSIDMVRQYGTVVLDGVTVGEPLGDAARTAKAMQRQWQIAVLLRCAEMVGALQQAFDITYTWAFDRYSFGRPLASYQVLKHRYADMFLGLQACESIVDAAVKAVAEGDTDADTLLSAAKAFVGEHGVSALHDCIQLHGGIGVTWEHDLHLYLRRVALNANTFGTPRDHQLALADHVEKVHG